MDNRPKVSVIIPIYNVEKYIEECMDSIINQSLREIEIICVNDGSSDCSGNIILSFAAKDERIVIIDIENEGPSIARNAGLKIAKGEYIYFLDSDDMLLEEALEELYSLAKQKDLENIYFDADSFFETGDLEKKHKVYEEYYHRKNLNTDVCNGQHMFVDMVENKGFRASVCLQFIRKDLLERNNIDFYANIIHEDELFTLKTIIVAQRVMHVEKRYYRRRVRESSIMTTQKGFNNAWGYFICCKEMYKFISDKEITQESFAALQKQLFSKQKRALDAVKNIKRPVLYECLEHCTNEDKMEFLVIIYEMSLLKKKEKKKSTSKKESFSYRVTRLFKHTLNRGDS